MISESATILIVEDEQDIRELLAYNLEKEGYATVQAADGKEGLELARSRKPDLILFCAPRNDGRPCWTGGFEIQAAAGFRTSYRLVTIEGTRVTTRSSWLPAQAGHLTDEQALLEITPDLAERDVFICGAPAWMDAVSAAARRAGLPADQLHVERFTY